MSLTTHYTAEVLVQNAQGHTAKTEHASEVSLCMTQNPVLRITLTGHTLIVTILAIIASIQFFHPSLTCTLIALSPLPWIIYNDYDNFISLGPGGTPSTFLGYVKITYLRLFALSDPYKPASFTGPIFPTVGYYQHAQSWLPVRNGPRPTIAGIAPQRQVDQPGCLKTNQALRAALTAIAEKQPNTFRIGTSCFEKKGLALFAQMPINTTCRGEICHVHDSDRSLHMNLHPDDAKVVLEKGWGERHPLARGGWMAAYVPREFVMVYAPRDRTELDVVCRIIEAAGFWVSSEQMELKAEKDRILVVEAR